MRVTQGCLVGNVLFWLLGTPLNISLVFTLITYRLQKRSMRNKNAITIISEKGFHPSCSLDLTCRRWHQVPLKNCIVPAILTEVTWTLLPPTTTQKGISTFKEPDLHACGKKMNFCEVPTFQRQRKECYITTEFCSPDGVCKEEQHFLCKIEAASQL